MSCPAWDAIQPDGADVLSLRRAAEQIAERILRSPTYTQARSLSIYVNMLSGEVDTNALCRAALKDGMYAFCSSRRDCVRRLTDFVVSMQGNDFTCRSSLPPHLPLLYHRLRLPARPLRAPHQSARLSTTT